MIENSFKGKKESELLKNLNESKKEVPKSKFRQGLHQFIHYLVPLIGDIAVTYILWNWQLFSLFNHDLTVIQSASLVVLCRTLFPVASISKTILNGINQTGLINNKK